MTDIYHIILKVSKRNHREEILELEPLIEKELEKEPHNTDLLIRLAMLVHEMPFVDPEKSVKLLSRILEYDHKNGLVMVLRAYMSYWGQGYIEESWCEQLSALSTGDAEVDSMMRYVASIYYVTQDKENDPEYKKLLVQSVELCQDHVRNCRDLAKLYLKEGNYSQAEKLAKMALKNYRSNAPRPDITDYRPFLNEFVKGISGSDFCEIQKIGQEAVAHDKLRMDPYNKEALLDLAMTKLFTFSLERERDFVIVNKILLHDADNPKALIMLAYRAYFDKVYDGTLLEKLTSIKTTDPEINSMLLFSASRLYINKDVKKCEKLLLQSIEEYSFHVYNYLELAKIYMTKNKLVEAKKMKQQALYNVARVFTRDELSTLFRNVVFLFNQEVKGIWLSKSEYEALYEELKTNQDDGCIA